MQIYIYISFARFWTKGFSIFVNTPFADLVACYASFAKSNSESILSVASGRCTYQLSNAHAEVSSWTFSLILLHHLELPFFNCSLIRYASHVLNVWEMNLFAFWLIQISRGWNFLVKLCGTITNLQSFFKHDDLISALSCLLKVYVTINEYCSFR